MTRPKPSSRSVACPTCKARRGVACFRSESTSLAPRSHPARIAKARALAEKPARLSAEETAALRKVLADLVTEANALPDAPDDEEPTYASGLLAAVAEGSAPMTAAILAELRRRVEAEAAKHDEHFAKGQWRPAFEAAYAERVLREAADAIEAMSTDPDTLSAEQWESLQRILENPQKAPEWLRRAIHAKPEATPAQSAGCGTVSGYVQHDAGAGKVWIKTIGPLPAYCDLNRDFARALVREAIATVYPEDTTDEEADAIIDDTIRKQRNT